MAGLLVKLAIMIGISVMKYQCIEISHWGNYFVFTFLQCSKDNPSTNMNNIIVITTRNVSSNINIMWMETNETWGVSLAPFEEYKLNLNSTVTAFPFGEILPRKAVVVMASTKVSVYGFSAHGSSVDGFLVIPVAGLGVEYRTVSPAEHGQSGPQIAVVAVEDETAVSIEFTTNNVCIFKGSTLSFNNGDVLSFTMDAYDVVNLNCSSDNTGSLVQSTKAVAVLSGSIAIPISEYPNHVMEMLPSTKDYGSRFVIQAPTGTGYVSKYRVIFHMNTLLMTNFESYLPGQYQDFVIDQNDKSTFCVFATENVLVVMIHMGKDSTENIGDAYMSIIPPVENYGNYYAVPYSLIANATDMLAIVVHTEHKHLLVPQIPVEQVKDCSDMFNAAVISLPQGSHIESALYHSVEAFSVVMYGYNVKHGYGFPAGFNVTDNSGTEECSSSPCLNNGWCIETSLSFRCHSPSIQLTTTEVATTTIVTTTAVPTTTVTTTTVPTTTTVTTNPTTTPTTNPTSTTVTTNPTTTTTATTTGNNPSTVQTTESLSSPESTTSDTETITNTQSSPTTSELTQTTTGGVPTSTMVESSTPSNSSTESSLSTAQNQNSTMYPVTTDSTTTPISEFGSNYSMCQCPCVDQLNNVSGILLHISDEQFNQILDKNNLSKTRRRKTSAENITQAERDLGGSAFFIIMSLCSLVVISDLMRLFNWIKVIHRSRKPAVKI